jgi:hypothetical protein
MEGAAVLKTTVAYALTECIKRGEANLCHGGSSDAILAANSARRVRPITTPYSDRHVAPANAAVVESLAKRVCAIEQLLSRIPSLPSLELLSDSPESGGTFVHTRDLRVDDASEEDGLEEGWLLLSSTCNSNHQCD